MLDFEIPEKPLILGVAGWAILAGICIGFLMAKNSDRGKGDECD